MNVPKILAVGTAVPEHCLQQETIKEFAASLFCSGTAHLDRLLPVFDHSHIRTRHFAQPLSWYAERHSFAEANTQYTQTALQLAETAACQALEQANMPAEKIGLVVFVSSTGLATPTLDARLIQDLGISPHACRLPVWGLGCAG